MRPAIQARCSLRLLCLAWLTAAALHAQPAPVITSIQQFWGMSPVQKSQPQDFVLDCTVTYFDPFWRILFVQDLTGMGAYVPYGDNPYAFKAGEAITARGRFIPPNADISF